MDDGGVAAYPTLRYYGPRRCGRQRLRRDVTVAPLRSLFYAAIYAGMSRTTSVNLPELIS